MRSFALFATIAVTVSALPNAVPVPVEYPGKCVMWPGWLNSPGNDVTGGIMVVPSSSDDEASNNLPMQPYSLPWQGSTRTMLGTDFRASRRFAKGYLRCIDGKLKLGWGDFEQVGIARDQSNAQLLVGAPAEKVYTPQLYYLEVDGKRLDGVYLGAQNKTTWGFVYHDAQCGANGVSQRDFQEAKLLDLPLDEANPPTAGYPAEFKAFLKVITY